jgi:hypothetical protein
MFRFVSPGRLFAVAVQVLLLCGVLVRQTTAQSPGAGARSAPTIQFDHVPRFGSTDLLSGHVTSVRPDDYVVLVAIRVRGGWWTKPTWADPQTHLTSESTFTCNVFTGGVDEQATEIAAFVVPRGYYPPRLAGTATIPRGMLRRAVASLTVRRSPE